MSKYKHFLCSDCGKQTGFSRPVERLLLEAKLASANETRDYSCEHCGTINQVELSSTEWTLVDGYTL
jgi:DNA-directed RNA polymerase subunit RPC12/RpoP